MYVQAEEANLPETMCRLTVGMRSVEELRALTLKAKDLMLNTPKSFRKILRSALYANLSQVDPQQHFFLSFENNIVFPKGCTVE